MYERKVESCNYFLTAFLVSTRDLQSVYGWKDLGQDQIATFQLMSNPQ